jgi:predicted phosphoribosyltransferase
MLTSSKKIILPLITMAVLLILLALRKQSPNKVVVAVPVAAKDAVLRIRMVGRQSVLSGEPRAFYGSRLLV